LKSVLLTSIPRYELVAPPAAIGVLQGIVKHHGLHSAVFDFNLYLSKNLTNEEWEQLDNWCIFLRKDIPYALKKKILGFWDEGVSRTIPKNCEYLLISVFSYWSLYVARLIIEHESQKLRPYKLIVGGNGVSSKFPDNGLYFKDWNNQHNFIEHLILGEGEVPLSNILSKGKITYADTSLDSFPFPTYNNFNFDEYQEKKIYITGSRGCVRRCTFCDIENIWPKFRYRSASSLVEEIKKHFYEHGITRFDFTDSLINGSVSNFYKFNVLLAEEKQKNNDLKDVGYLGQFICRPKNQMPESHYEAMHFAGCTQLTVGIESFSERVRDHMKKKFSDKDVEYHLEQSGYWNIQNVLLMITGYPTETIEDHLKNLSDLEKYKVYAKAGVIEMIRWGTTMHLIADTPITNPDNVRKLGLRDEDNRQVGGGELATYNWSSTANPTLTLNERLRRRIELHEKTLTCGYPQPNVENELTTILEMAKVFKN
jgi:hypothetical protein